MEVPFTWPRGTLTRGPRVARDHEVGSRPPDRRRRHSTGPGQRVVDATARVYRPAVGGGPRPSEDPRSGDHETHFGRPRSNPDREVEDDTPVA